MQKIVSIRAREIIDSRGNPTIEAECVLEGKVSATASVPSGASTGIHEAVELRDGDKKRYRGLGVLKAVKNVNETISKSIKNKKFDQRALDDLMLKLDGTKNKGKLGANAILAVSMAFARASAKKQGIELYKYLGDLREKKNRSKTFNLPHPMFNIINGGKHADSGLDIQEFMVIPVGFKTFERKVQAGAEIISALKRLLVESGYSIGIGDEGGFAPQLGSNEEALELIEEAIKNAGYNFKNVKIGLDVASSNFYENGIYKMKVGGQEKTMTSTEMISWYEDLIKAHPILSIEDGLAEDDWEGYTEMNKRLGKKIRIIGDDLTVTNIERIHTAIEKKSINAVLIKLNQIGSLSETIDAIELTKKAGWIPFISHRSGETTDTFISDLAAGLSCEFIKTGSLVRGERVCKYNRLMEIEKNIQRK